MAATASEIRICRCDFCTAYDDPLRKPGGKQILLQGSAADEAEASRPKRKVPVMLTSPDEAAPCFHVDWTAVPGSDDDPVLWALGKKLRDVRNQLLREHLEKGLRYFTDPRGLR